MDTRKCPSGLYSVRQRRGTIVAATPPRTDWYEEGKHGQDNTGTFSGRSETEGRRNVTAPR